MRRWSMVLAVALGLLPLARQVSAAEPERATVNGVTLERLEGTEPNWRVIGVDRMRKFDVLDLTQEALGGRQVVELPAGDFKVSFYDPDKREEVEDDLKLSHLRWSMEKPFQDLMLQLLHGRRRINSNFISGALTLI